MNGELKRWDIRRHAVECLGFVKMKGGPRDTEVQRLQHEDAAEEERDAAPQSRDERPSGEDINAETARQEDVGQGSRLERKEQR
jgi:hypothetical protein